MVLSFTGEHTQKVDGKGRMSIPADFRRVLESQDPDWTDGLTPRMYLLYGEHLKKELQRLAGAQRRVRGNPGEEFLELSPSGL